MMKKSIMLFSFLSLLAMSQLSSAFVNESDPNFCSAFQQETRDLCYEAAGILGPMFCSGSMNYMYGQLMSYYGGGNLDQACAESVKKIVNKQGVSEAQLASQCKIKWGCYWGQPVAGDTSCATNGKAPCEMLS